MGASPTEATVLEGVHSEFYLERADNILLGSYHIAGNNLIRLCDHYVRCYHELLVTLYSPSRPGPMFFVCAWGEKEWSGPYAQAHTESPRAN